MARSVRAGDSASLLSSSARAEQSGWAPLYATRTTTRSAPLSFVARGMYRARKAPAFINFFSKALLSSTINRSWGLRLRERLGGLEGRLGDLRGHLGSPRGRLVCTP